MVGLQQRYKELRRSSVPRYVHEKVLKEVLEQNKQPQQDAGSLSLQTEARDVEKERCEEKVLALQKEVNHLCMLSARKDVSMEHKKLAADVALNELRLDKEASDTYHQHILQLLQQEVEKGINTEEDLQQEIQAMKALETKHKNSKWAQAHSCGGLHRQHGWCGHSNQMVSYMPMHCKTTTRWKKLAFHFLTLTIIQAQCLYLKLRNQPQRKPVMLENFAIFNWMKLPLTWKELQPLLVMMWIDSHVASSTSWRNDLTISIATFAMQKTKHALQPKSSWKTSWQEPVDKNTPLPITICNLSCQPFQQLVSKIHVPRWKQVTDNCITMNTTFLLKTKKKGQERKPTPEQCRQPSEDDQGGIACGTAGHWPQGHSSWQRTRPPANAANTQVSSFHLSSYKGTGSLIIPLLIQPPKLYTSCHTVTTKMILHSDGQWCEPPLHSIMSCCGNRSHQKVPNTSQLVNWKVNGDWFKPASVCFLAQHLTNTSSQIAITIY